jgi:hypothetical protein
MRGRRASLLPRTAARCRCRVFPRRPRLLTFNCLTDSVHIRDILRPPRSELRGDQIFTGNETCSQLARLINDFLNPSRPSRIKLYTGNCCENIDADRFAPDAKARTGLRKVCEGQAFRRRSEFRESRKYCLGVIGAGLHQDVEIFGRAGLRVDGNRIGSDNEIFNAVRVQSGQEFFEV